MDQRKDVDLSPPEPKLDDRYVVKAVPKVFVKSDVDEIKTVDVEKSAEPTPTDSQPVRESTVIDEPVVQTDDAVVANATDAVDPMMTTTTNLVKGDDVKIPETPNKTEPDIPSFRYQPLILCEPCF